MKETVESKQIHYVKFSHWLNSDSERQEEMYLYNDGHKNLGDVQKWVEDNFTPVNDKTNTPIVWEIKFIAFSFSMDTPISKQDY